MDEESNGKIENTDVIEGHKVCQTRNAKWLCLNNVHGHFHRPNLYDIGGTYNDDIGEFWFVYKTEQVSQLYILHLFVCNHEPGSFNISLCTGNEVTINDRNNSVQLTSISGAFEFENVNERSYNYLTTYSFGELDVELMKDRKLMIAITFKTERKKKGNIPSELVKGLHDFGQLISDPIGADFVIETGDGDKFHVHKFLLPARSEVFKAMLKFDTAESKNNHVKIADVGKEDLECLIEFLYTGTIKDLDNSNCFNLLMLADRYDVKGLKELAQYALAQQMNTDNALEILTVADLYNSATLKTIAFKFIKANVAALESSVFQDIHNIQLVQDLCKYLAIKN